MTMPVRRLTRSRDRVFGGVCGGVAEFLGWAPVGVRALYVFASLMTAFLPGVIVYALLWWTIPEAGDDDRFRLESFRKS